MEPLSEPGGNLYAANGERSMSFEENNSHRSNTMFNGIPSEGTPYDVASYNMQSQPINYNEDAHLLPDYYDDDF